MNTPPAKTIAPQSSPIASETHPAPVTPKKTAITAGITAGSASTATRAQHRKNARNIVNVDPGTRLKGESPGAGVGTTSRAELTALTPSRPA